MLSKVNIVWHRIDFSSELRLVIELLLTRKLYLT